MAVVGAVNRTRIRVLVGVARAQPVVVRQPAVVHNRKIDRHELGVVVVSAHAVATAHVRPKGQSVARVGVGVVRQHLPRVPGRSGVPIGFVAVEPLEEAAREQHAVARARQVTVPRCQMRHFGLRGGRLHEAGDVVVAPPQVGVALPRVAHEPALQHGVRPVHDGRADHLRRPRAHLQLAPRIEPATCTTKRASQDSHIANATIEACKGGRDCRRANRRARSR